MSIKMWCFINCKDCKKNNTVHICSRCKSINDHIDDNCPHKACVFNCGFCEGDAPHICGRCGVINLHRGSKCNVSCNQNCGVCVRGKVHRCRRCGALNSHRTDECPNVRKCFIACDNCALNGNKNHKCGECGDVNDHIRSDCEMYNARNATAKVNANAKVNATATAKVSKSVKSISKCNESDEKYDEVYSTIDMMDVNPAGYDYSSNLLSFSKSVSKSVSEPSSNLSKSVSKPSSNLSKSSSKPSSKNSRIFEDVKVADVVADVVADIDADANNNTDFSAMNTVISGFVPDVIGGLIVKEHGGKLYILIQKRSERLGGYNELPGGSYEGGNVLNEALREINEETGINAKYLRNVARIDTVSRNGKKSTNFVLLYSGKLSWENNGTGRNECSEFVEDPDVRSVRACFGHSWALLSDVLKSQKFINRMNIIGKFRNIQKY